MKKFILPFLLAASLFCAGSANAQGTYFQGAMTPSAAPFIGFAMLAKSGASSAHTGDTNETTLATISIPANTLGANGTLKINAIWSFTNSANTKTFRWRLGGLAGTVIASNTASTFTNAWSQILMINANATNSQNTFLEQVRGTDGLVTTSFQIGTAVDMTATQSLVITGQLASGAETVTLLGYTVEVAN
jgi:hypothetical protein